MKALWWIFLNIFCIFLCFQIVWWKSVHLERRVVDGRDEILHLQKKIYHLHNALDESYRRERYMEKEWKGIEYQQIRLQQRNIRCRQENEQYALKYMDLLQTHPNITNERWVARSLDKSREVNSLLANRFLSMLQKSFKTKFTPPPTSHPDEILQRDPQTYPNVRFQRLLPSKTPPEGSAKIIGLTGIRNGAVQLPYFLKSISKYTDAIIILDDNSDDGTGEIVRSLARSFNIEILINKTVWHRDENLDHNILLRAGRELAGGTHFIFLDYDESLSASCQDQDFLRQKIISLRPGQRLYLEWVLFWNSTENWRPGFLDRRVLTIFADDKKSLNEGHHNTSLQMHLPRIPVTGRVIDASTSNCKLLEFRFINLDNCALKEIWYFCIGRVRGNVGGSFPGYSGVLYSTASYPIEKVPSDWLDQDLIEFAKSMDVVEAWRAIQVIKWFKDYGEEFFEYFQEQIGYFDWKVIEDLLTAEGALSSLPKSSSFSLAKAKAESENIW
eukprot:TRINITY_DN378_c0_g1_i1.p1 TRINITY_DN378_c0_g1~~TRINITY_DN378_c0_g1_i1.p1  ORF type:complete len:500 (-),score=98.31 TRINITY_DN378_c0_g1_i1:38-1537(-)